MSDPGTSSRLHPLQRPKFHELLTYAPRIHDGAFSAPWTSPSATRAPASCCPP
ncbi:hypothetical protein GTW78_16165 [Streptomyces sp. SID4948]|uniref:hypothetical protein n=1 Tax=Streptomyces sp. SID4948 TaxID=2690287 RepID=UPI001368223B|nr:hypothetical protein [Streptomyces sp. SID4948]MYS21699.1 hypothetical protein [Streptomyces sp. SID4948]